MKVWNSTSSWSHSYFKPLVITSICGGYLRPFNTSKKIIIVFVLFFVFIAVPSQALAFLKAVDCLIEEKQEIRDRNLGLFITFAGLSLSGLIPTFLGLSYFPKKLSRLLKTYDNLRTDPLFELHLSRSRIVLKIYVLILTFSVVFLSILLIFGSPPFVEAKCLSAPVRFQMNEIVLWISIGLIPVQSTIIFVQRFTTYGFTSFFTNIVLKEFARLNMEFEKLVTTTVTVPRIEVIRKRYFDICDFVTAIDDFLTPLISTYLVYSLTAICLDIHALNYGLLTSVEVVAYCILVGISVFEVTFIMVNGGLMAAKSKCCSEISKQFSMSKMNTQSMNAMTLFIENIRSSEVGLSFLKLFVLDKTAMMTITGTLISYIIVVLQMKPSSI